MTPYQKIRTVNDTMTRKKTIFPTLAICIVAGIALAVMAPYGTHTLSTPLQLTYWVGLCLAGGIAPYWIYQKWIDGTSLSLWKIIGIQSCASTLVVTTALLSLSHIFLLYGDRPSAIILLFYVAVIAIIINSVAALISSNRSAKLQIETAQIAAATHQEQSLNPPAIMGRLPVKLRTATLYALHAQDHYVNIITDQGAALIHMRLRDAIKETAPLSGLQPHRSWWVAQDGVESIKGATLILHTGQNIPISRSGKTQIRALKWH